MPNQTTPIRKQHAFWRADLAIGVIIGSALTIMMVANSLPRTIIINTEEESTGGISVPAPGDRVRALIQQQEDDGELEGEGDGLDDPNDDEDLEEGE